MNRSGHGRGIGLTDIQAMFHDALNPLPHMLLQDYLQDLTVKYSKDPSKVIVYTVLLMIRDELKTGKPDAFQILANAANRHLGVFEESLNNLIRECKKVNDHLKTEIEPALRKRISSMAEGDDQEKVICLSYPKIREEYLGKNRRFVNFRDRLDPDDLSLVEEFLVNNQTIGVFRNEISELAGQIRAYEAWQNSREFNILRALYERDWKAAPHTQKLEKS